jgi:hypothetical protein
MPTPVYTTLRSSADWERARSQDHTGWSYDQNGALPVEREVFAALAQPKVYTVAGWDTPPPTYPARAARYLDDPPEPEPEPYEREADEERTRKRGRRPPKRPDRNITRSFRLPMEAPEKIDFLCEVYRMSAGQVVARLIDEAYRRDVVESGALEVLADDLGIIAPRP